MATLTSNLAIGALHLAGRHDTTEATRWASRRMNRLTPAPISESVRAGAQPIGNAP
jgi:hypothetical protein